MLRLLIISLLVLLPTSASASLKVVTTVPDLAALTVAIGGDRVDVHSLSLSTQDPHWVDPRPSLVVKANKADLLIAVGMELEVGWLPAVQTSARNGKIQVGARGFLDCSTYIRRLEVPTSKISRSMGDIHASGNPHYLYDPRAAVVCAEGIRNKLIELDPSQAGYYSLRFTAFHDLMEGKIREWERALKGIRGAPVVTYHRSFVYLAQWAGLRVIAQLEPKPGVPPSPSHIARVLGTARKESVRAILQESYYPSRTGTLVAKKLGGALLSLPGGTAFEDGQSYVAKVDGVVRALTGSLAGAR